MSLEQRTQITAEAVQKLAPELWGKPRVAAVLQSLTEEIQEFENAVFSVIDARLLDNATGANLRVLGAIVGQKDYGYDDSTLRAVIRARIRANQSNGKLQDIRDVVALLTPGSPYTLTDGLNSGSIVLHFTDASVTFLARALALILKDTRGGGVRIEMSRPMATNVFTYRARAASNNTNLGYESGTWLDKEFI